MKHQLQGQTVECIHLPCLSRPFSPGSDGGIHSSAVSAFECVTIVLIHPWAITYHHMTICEPTISIRVILVADKHRQMHLEEVINESTEGVLVILDIHPAPRR